MIENIVWKDIPCWYELLWNDKLVLRVHKDFANIATIVEEDLPIVSYFMKEFRFSSWKGDIKKDFGFDNALKYKGDKDDFVEFFIPIPKVKEYINEPCRYCQGRKFDTIINDKCGFCEGTGKEHVMNWKSAQAISASLNVFFTLACYPEARTSAKFPQLMTIQLSTRHDLNGSALGGEFSVSFCRWLNSFKGRFVFPKAVKAMQKAAKKMFGSIDNEGFGFRAGIEDGGVSINVPGNACGIYGARDYSFENREIGGKFESHNVDTPMQQLEILIGLATLHDYARKKIIKGGK
jgi:hypothetical protein